MQNNYHTNVERTSLLYLQWINVELLPFVKKIWRRNILSDAIEKTKEATVYLLTTLGVSGIFLGGAYLFLRQLAEYGW